MGSSEGGGEAMALLSEEEGRERDHTAMACGQTKTDALVPLPLRMSKFNVDGTVSLKIHNLCLRSCKF